MSHGPLSPFLIQELPGFTPQISGLLVMMNYARYTTLAAVQDLTTSQLDYLHDAHSNTIGALLGHIASVEVAYQVDTFEGRGLTAQEMARIMTWGGLRGGISVALALSLPPGRERDVILAITYAVVVFSIVVQGLTLKRVVERTVLRHAAQGVG